MPCVGIMLIALLQVTSAVAAWSIDNIPSCRARDVQGAGSVVPTFSGHRGVEGNVQPMSIRCFSQVAPSTAYCTAMMNGSDVAVVIDTFPVAQLPAARPSSSYCGCEDRSLLAVGIVTTVGVANRTNVLTGSACCRRVLSTEPKADANCVCALQSAPLYSRKLSHHLMVHGWITCFYISAYRLLTLPDCCRYRACLWRRG